MWCAAGSHLCLQQALHAAEVSPGLRSSQEILYIYMYISRFPS